jgi:hypothetical protein
MKIHDAKELNWFLKEMKSDVIYLSKPLYNLLIEKDWDCPLGIELKKAIREGLKVYKD